MMENDPMHIEHNHDQLGEQAKACAICEKGHRRRGVVSLSIILSAILISGSILYSSNLINKSLGKLSGTNQVLGATTENPSNAQAAAQAPAAPTGPVTVADRAAEPMLGSNDAKVTMIEFGDFQCPFCQNYFKQTLPQIKSQYVDTGKVKIIFRHFPLPFHVNAEIAGVAAECANQQGKFWEYHDLLYTNGQGDGTNLDAASLKKYAAQLGLGSKFNSCLDAKSTLQIVQNDMAEGTKDGVSGTPTFYINGVQLVGAQPIAAFQAVIDKALKE